MYIYIYIYMLDYTKIDLTIYMIYAAKNNDIYY